MYFFIKRIFDILFSAIGLVLLSPILLLVLLIIWLQDFHSPFYIASRVGKGNKDFKMIKLRSMIKNADQQGIDSTSASDMRITLIGHVIRRFKLDEMIQLWNVLIGNMSLVGPRPNVRRHGVDLYTKEEMKLITVKPGITDFSSIVFSDEGDILKDHTDPDLAYDQLIRPWKSMLGIFYITKANFFIDLCLIALTVIGALSRGHALKGINKMLIYLNAPADMTEVAKREKPLYPFPPPGYNKSVTTNNRCTSTCQSW